MRVMTFNLGGAYPGLEGRASWPERKGLAADVVRRQAPDVVGFQEFDRVHVAWVEAWLPGYRCLPGLPGDSVGRPTFNALVWLERQWRLHANGGWYLNEERSPWVRGWDAAHVRTASWAHLEDRESGQPLLCVTTHLDNVGETSRRHSMSLLLQLIDEQNERDLPVVLLGDFNTNAHGEADPAVPGGLLQQAIAAGYDDAFLAAAATDDASAFTFHAYEGLDYRADLHQGLGRIDWILTRGLTVSGCARVTDAEPPSYASDHWPVVADLDRRAPSAPRQATSDQDASTGRL